MLQACSPFVFLEDEFQFLEDHHVRAAIERLFSHLLAGGGAVVAVVLLGAGASYGSGDVHPEPPPLGKDLFRKLEQRGGVAATLPAELKQLFYDDFEAGMERYARASLGDVSDFQRELAEFLAEFEPGPTNVYRKMIDALGIDRVIYCSLNYDLLLEDVAMKLGYSIAYSLERANNSFVRIIKPHGSANVWPDPSVFQLQGVSIINMAGPALDGRVIALDRTGTLRHCKTQDSVAPSMSMYAVGKAVTMCPTWVSVQQEFWREIVERASRLFVVGVRVHQADAHIWEILAKAKSQLFYFGVTDNDRVEFNDWIAKSGRKNAQFIKSDFAGSVPFMKNSLNIR